MSNRKSNQNICDFYKDKSKDRLTKKYFEKYGLKKKGNLYLGLYDDFVKLNTSSKKEFSGEGIDKDNKSLYRVIEAWKDIERAKFPIEIYDKHEKLIRIIDCPSKMPNLGFLKDIDIDLLNPALNLRQEANQKWHLFVGIFAYSVVCKSPFKWEKYFTKKFSCKILRLWMIENAENQEDALKNIEEAIANDTLERALIDNAFNAFLEEG